VRNRARLGALGLAIAVACACAASDTVRITETWPDRPPDYVDAYHRWTRHATASAEFVQLIDAQATLAAPEWRAAYVAERARKAALPADEVARLLQAQRTESAEVWEIELMVATHKLEYNDFARGDRSMWRVVLITDDGRQVPPSSIKEDKRPAATLEGLFPETKLFQHAYTLRFPKVAADGKPLVGDNARRLTLLITSELTQIAMTWGS
jgi:hypothetical protein